MKKQIFILAMVAIGFVACSSDETIAVNNSTGNEISFRTLVDGTTRSTAGPMAGGTNFAVGDVINVYADFYDASTETHYNYFQDNFTKRSEGGFTATDKQYYWPAFDDQYDKMTFTALYGAEGNSGSPVSGVPGKVLSFTPWNDYYNNHNGHMMDLMVARSEFTSNPGSQVVLNFRHALSQILVKVKNSNGALAFDVSGVRIGYLSRSGEFHYDMNFTDPQDPVNDYGPVTTTQETQANAEAGTVTPTNPQGLVKRTNWKPSTVSSASDDIYEQTSGISAGEGPGGINGAIDATALSGFKEWLLIPQTQTGFTAYTSGTQIAANDIPTANPVVNGCYIALQLQIYNYNGSTRTNKLVDTQWCYWPIAANWLPGYKYTYTVDLAGGGYQPGNVDQTEATTLDKVLGDAIVFSPDCTVDYWVTTNENNVTMPNN